MPWRHFQLVSIYYVCVAIIIECVDSPASLHPRVDMQRDTIVMVVCRLAGEFYANVLIYMYL